MLPVPGWIFHDGKLLMTVQRCGSMDTIAVVGATGYLGGRLDSELLREGFYVRAISRSAENLRWTPYATSDRLQITRADAREVVELIRALSGCASCYTG